jgi:hypothetical protein
MFARRQATPPKATLAVSLRKAPTRASYPYLLLLCTISKRRGPTLVRRLLARTSEPDL